MSKNNEDEKIEKRKAYYEKWWATNGKRMLELRRERYEADESFRNKFTERAKKQWEKKRKRNLQARSKKLDRNIEKIKSDLSKKVIRTLRPRKIEIDGNIEIVYGTTELIANIGLSRFTAKRWADRGVLPKPSFIDSKNRYWYTMKYIREVSNAYRAIRESCSGLYDIREALKKQLPAYVWE